ncbi:Peptidyl-prolyl cis-trans isomerase A precursor [Bosea sp. LC85]|uniref:peptidylprolyl isomerase n=1 Tax=Bosea sp. LC85 TaxID=1502851 RepID=UPI0004E3BB9F|nr:peptidylprolyl isomerase [Bosea sp. LC85]KFC69658.1 Peptidyl-prolyl cis-trans isomerase A precursor [Bosea sp. LC85]
MVGQMAHGALVQVDVETQEGAFLLAIDEARAPLTARNFLAYVDGGLLDNATVYRIVTLANQPPATEHKIEVIQWGWPAPADKREPPLPPVPHEPTSVTGLRHLDGTLSLARLAPGTGGHGFFICVGDQPELDEGGGRNPDRAGFAAFGKVIAGRDTIQRIFAQAELVEYLEKPIRILRARRRELA